MLFLDSIGIWNWTRELKNQVSSQTNTSKLWFLWFVIRSQRSIDFCCSIIYLPVRTKPISIYLRNDFEQCLWSLLISLLFSFASTRESIGTFSFSWLYTFCFVFCVIHSTRFQQAHNRIHAMDIHLRNQQPKIAMLEWNVFHTSVHLFYLFLIATK